ncbi:MAG: recombination protein RecR [Bdellovibrionales bacterium]|nr:recombination protein RecR [Bdellovibrionales bacterium]
MLHVPSLERLVNELSKLPGIGPKTAQRLGYYVLRSTSEYNEALQLALEGVRKSVHECPKCFSFTENQSLCFYCEDQNRLDDTICVVEDPADIARFDSSGAFKGRYHVLHGAISPLEGILPKDIRLQPLLERIQNENIKEVILALDADLEGDTTVLYISKQLHGKGVKLSRIAHGIPIGGDIDYIDFRTLGRAIENRVEI